MELRTWAIHQHVIERAIAIEGYLDGKAKANSYPKPLGYHSLDADGFPAVWSFGDGLQSLPGKVAIIPVQGMMVKGLRWWGYADTAYITEQIKKIDADPQFSAMVLDMETPGGSVNGIEELANVIKTAKKPIVAYVNDMACSGGYWIASQARKVIVSSEAIAQVGSIGVLQVYQGQYRMLKEIGLDTEILRSTNTPDKAKPNSLEPITDTDRARVIEDLDTIYDLFVATVKAGRGSKIKKDSQDLAFSGQVFNGREAIQMGLVDGRGTLQEAIDQALALASSATSSGSNASNMVINTTSNQGASGNGQEAPAAPAQATTAAAVAPASSEAPAPTQAPAPQPTPTAAVPAAEPTLASIAATLNTLTQVVANQGQVQARLVAFMDGKPAPGVAPKSDAASIAASGQASTDVPGYHQTALAIHKKLHGEAE